MYPNRKRMMNKPNDKLKVVRTMRWIARIMSLLLAIFVVIRIFTPDPYATEPVPAEDWFLLSLWGVAILGLLLAWKWEFQGAVMVIVTMFLREIVWLILKGSWLVNFLIVWAIIVPPALLYLGAWWIEKRIGSSKETGTFSGDV